jgi:hypothetical protein
LAIGTGSKTFTTQAGLAYVAGSYVQIFNTGTPANYMYGTVTSYSGTSLVVNVTATGGSGTIAAWSISLMGATGPQGAAGAAGAQGAAGAAGATGAQGAPGVMIYNSSGTAQSTYSISVGTATISNFQKSVNVTLSGNGAFTSATAYACQVNGASALGALTVSYTSGTAFTINSASNANLTNGGVFYYCVGS